MESFKEYITELFDESSHYKIIEVKERISVRNSADDDYDDLVDDTKNFTEEIPDVGISFKFKVDDSRDYHYAVTYTHDKSKQKEWELVFGKVHKGSYWPKQDYMEVTGDAKDIKETIKIFGTVFETILDMLDGTVGDDDHYYPVKKIKFSANLKETSRVRLYKRFIKRLQKELSDDFEVNSSDNEDGFAQFYIKKIDFKERLKRKAEQEEKERKEKREEKRKAEERKKKEEEERKRKEEEEKKKENSKDDKEKK